MQETVKLIERTFLFGTANAIYSVQTKDAGTVYMRVQKSNYYNEKRAVVIVDSARLLAAWRASTGPAWRGMLHRLFGTWKRSVNVRREWLAHLPLSAWREDYKIKRAERGFAEGRKNPVPLARVGLAGQRLEDGVAFGDGTTRSLWLWVNSAPAFPVECRAKEAKALQRIAGVEWAYSLTVEDLLGDMSWSDWVQKQTAESV